RLQSSTQIDSAMSGTRVAGSTPWHRVRVSDSPRTIEQLWQRYDAMESRLTAKLSARMLALGGVRPAMRVLDLATGRGEPAIPAALAVGPHGRVVGVDVSPTMLAMARERARRNGIEDARLVLHAVDAAAIADVTAASTFDLALARWGLMYMSEPRAVLAGVRRALVDGRLLVVAVWAEPERVIYWSMPRAVLARVTAVPMRCSSLGDGAAGIFRYSSPDALPRDLRAEGFTVEQTEDVELAVMEAATAADAIAWVRAFAMGRLLDGVTPDVSRAWEAEMTDELESRRGNDGMIRLGGVTRIVVARAG
ncbi:MAG: class I SAM-dependent methyltransferase, partial [Labilithrix sp.]|nr:class I SAM-dependent methyltransferase [Labilithrix sp.]